MNLTHDDCSGVDVLGEWVEDRFELEFRFNHDDQDDASITMLLDIDELTALKSFLQRHIDNYQQFLH